MLSADSQAYVFLSTVYAGFIIGFFYDCCRILRKMVRAGIVITGILDLLFWSLMGMLSFLVIFYVNDGDVRLYTIAGFVIGWILYVLTLSPFIMKSLTWIYKTLAGAIQWLVNIILWPFRMLWKTVSCLIIRLKKSVSPWFSKIKCKLRSIIKKTAKNQTE